jgi:hypothetical protein
MADLSSLMKIAPITGAGMVGAEHAQGMQTEALRQRQLEQMIAELMQKNQESQQMAPERLRHQQLQNQGLQLGLPGIEADSSKKASDAALKAGTLQTDISSGNAKNVAETGKAQAEQMASMSKVLGQLGIELEQTPDVPGARSSVLMKRLEAIGVNPQDPKHQPMIQGLSKLPSAQLPGILKKQAEDVMKMSREFLQAQYTADQSRASHKEVTGMNNKTQLDLEDKRIGAGKYNKGKVAATLEQSIDAAKSARERHQKLIDAATIAKQHGDAEAYANYMARAEAIRPQAVEELKAAPNGGVNAAELAKLPTNPGPQIAPPGAAASPAPAGPGAAGAAQVAPPGAIAKLRSNPALAAAFDQKYGPGAAAKALGK